MSSHGWADDHFDDEPNFIRRAVLLIETSDGLQHGYQVNPCREARITWDPPTIIDARMRYREQSRSGEIWLKGTLTGMVRLPSNAFDDEPALNPARQELPRGERDG